MLRIPSRLARVVISSLTPLVSFALAGTGIAQERDLELNMREAAAQAEEVRSRTSPSAKPARGGAGPVAQAKRLEEAARLLTDIGDRTMRGAAASETREDFATAARLLHQAYQEALVSGQSIDADAMDALISELKKIEATYHDSSP
jgi:hypothetical protein